LSSIHNKSKIKRDRLRYIILNNSRLYVYESKGKDAKILKLSKDMSVEVQNVSRQHGQCIILKDVRHEGAIIEGERDSDIVCTILPVRLTPEFFQDESYSQIVQSAQFKKIRDGLFAIESAPIANDSSRPILKEVQLSASKTPHPNNSKIPKQRQCEWPTTFCETVPIEQHSAVLHIQFALDAALKCSKQSSRSSSKCSKQSSRSSSKPS